MTTITIDIPDDTAKEVMAQLEKLGVTVRESTIEFLDGLTKDDYLNHFQHQAKKNQNKILKHL